MTLPTCNVLCSIYDDAGVPISGATITARLNQYEVYLGYVVPQLITGTTNENGQVTLALWPNQLGSTESMYVVKIFPPNGKSLTVNAVIPNVASTELHLVAELPAYTGKTDGQLILDAAVAAGAIAVSKAAEAAASATNAATSATNAATSATTSTTQATAAGNSATTATTKAALATTAATTASTAATTASTAATTATTQAGIASSAAGVASSSATAASGSATTATTQATNAANSASASGASATAASTSAATASTAATTATTQAGLAASSAAGVASAVSSATAQAAAAANSAGIANTQAGIASSAATTATTQANLASYYASGASTSTTNAANSATAAANSANTATTQAGIATTQAGISTTQAGISTTQADIATTQATNSANSATAAAGSLASVVASATNAANSATNAASSANTATTQAGISTTQAGIATTQATNSANSATAAAASAVSALNAPGTSGTSTTSLTIGVGTQTFTTQTAKAWVVGQFVTIAGAAPANAMNGYISAYNSGTGSMSVVVSTISGSGTFASWTIGLSAPIPANAVLQSDIGYAANQIPLNQYLGSMAYQSSNAVAITGGSGSFSTLNSSGDTRLGGLSGNQSLQVNNVASAVNYAQIVGALTGQYAALTTQGADANVGLLVNSKGTYPVTINSALEINPTASSVNFISFYGAVTGGAPAFVAKGSDANVAMGFATKGTQGFAFYTNNFGAQQAAITHTASAVNYLQLTGAATGNAPTISVQGSDANIDLKLTPKGTGVVALGGTTVASSGFSVTTPTGTVDRVNIYGSAGANPYFEATGTSATINLAFYSKGFGQVLFGRNGGAQNFLVGTATSSVNYLQVVPAATTGAPELSAQGSDTNINLKLTPKGTGVLQFGTYTAGVLSATGYITITDAGGTSRRLLVG